MTNKEPEAKEKVGPTEYEFYIMRHGIAVARGPSMLDDAKRPLTPEGKQKMREIAAGLARLGLELDWVVSSPLVRAVETAEILAEGLTSKPPIEFSDALRPGGPPEALISFVAKKPTRHRVMVVGHEPDLAELAARLIGAGRSANLAFKKGGCCLITFPEFPPKSPGKLLWWLTPRLMKKLGK